MQNGITASASGGVAAALALAGWAAAQSAVPPGPPPSWESLIPCAQAADPVQGFKCYQDAMRAAGYAPGPAAVAADRRKSFGLEQPRPHGRKREAAPKVAAASPAPAAAAPSPAPAASAPPGEEPRDRVSVTLDQVAVIPPLGRLLMVTTEGAVWLQTDDETVAPLPRAGQAMTIVRGSIDGYFCQFDKRTKVRCVRRH